MKLKCSRRQMLAMVSITLFNLGITAKVTGKSYATGDTIHLEGFHAIVIKADTNGEHGVAMSYPAYNDNDWLKRENSFIKRTQNEVKKKALTEAEANYAIADYKAQRRVPIMQWEKKKGGWICRFDEFKEELLPGWRIGTQKDLDILNEFMITVSGGKTSRLVYRPQYMKNVDLNYEWKENMHEMMLNGFLIEAIYSVARKEAYGGQYGFYPYPKYWDGVMTVIFKDF